MRYALIAVACLVALIVVVIGIGYALPTKHHASRAAHYPVSPAALFATITDVERYPTWRSDVTQVEVVSRDTAATSFRELGRNGAILYEIKRREPGRLFVTRIADPNLPFGGTWTYELSPAPEGTSLRITEDGEVRNPVFRFVSRFVLGQTATIDRYLTDLGRHVGATPAIVD
jgi:polyketide cyclase/dehydrase/lipid transport protein